MLNKAHETWLQCREINDSLLVAVDSCAVGFHVADSAIQSLKNQITSYQFLNIHQQSAIDTLTAVIKDQKKEIRRLKVHKGLMGAFGGILVGIIGYLLIAHG